MTRKLSEETVQKIREDTIEGKSRYEIASEMGLSPTVIYAYTKDIPGKRQREPCIRGKTLALLKNLLKKGYVSTGNNRTSLRFLQKIFPVIKCSQFKNRSIYYLEDKNKLALREMMEMDSSRIISYQELSRMTQVFNTDIKIMQKRLFIGRNRKRRGYKIKSRKQHHESFSKERQTLLDEFLGRILHSEVLLKFFLLFF
ncbi:MAG TPA: hypothetical protein HA346_01205 [Thermoplasmata archaeon]|nr:hypothetical protein [Thermoplasmata archaeon]